MASARVSFAFSICMVTGIALLSGCAHHNSVLPAVNRNAASTSATVIYRKTYERNDPSESAAIRRPSGTAYMGSVTTMPAIVTMPTDVAYDPDDGNYYIVGQGNDGYTAQVLRVNASGATSLFATFPGPAQNIAYDHATRTFYVTSRGTPTNSYIPGVYAIDSTGKATVIAGGANSGQVDGQGSAASFSFPSGITLDTKDGALYIIDYDRIRRMTTSGKVTTFTVGGSIGGNGGYYFPSGIVWSPYDGNFYAADNNGDVIRKITPAGVVSTLAGECATVNGAYYCAPLQRDGKGSNALFASPSGITVNPATGVLYVADSYNNSIRQVRTDGTVTTLAGNGLTQDVDGAGLNASFNTPVSLTYGGGQLVVVESNGSTRSSAVRAVTVSGAVPPPLQTRVTLFDTKRAAAPIYAIDWRATTPASSILWYTETDGHLASLTTAGASTEYAIAPGNGYAATLSDLVLGNDGSVWMYEPVDGRMKHRTTSGTIVSYTLKYSVSGSAPNWPDTVAAAPNGTIFVTQQNNDVQYVTSSGTVGFIGTPNYYFVHAIASGADSTIWGTNGYSILHIDRTGTVLNSYAYPAQFITRASDGSIWFTQPDAIGKLNPATNVIEVFPLYQPIPGCSGCSRGVGAIAQGSDGAFWFTEANVGAIGRIDANGVFSEYTIFSAHRHPFDIVAGPDGNMWFTDTGSLKIGRVRVH